MSSVLEKEIALEAKPQGLHATGFFSALLFNRYFLYLVSIVVFLAVWHWAAVGSRFASYMPTPAQVLSELTRIAGDRLAGKSLWGHLWASLHRVLIGFVIAIAIGVPVGLLMALNRYINALVKPLFDLIKPMPPISWISLSILWFGIGEESKVFIIAIGAFVPALINTYNGIRLVDPALYDVVRMLGGNKRQEMLQVTFPAGFPALFAGLQIALSVAWGCVLAAELVGARSGMGFIIILGMTMSKPAMILGGMVVIAVTAYLLTVILTKAEQVICPWKTDLSQ
ncbi:MAG: ABC transporter permease [Desulfobacteraceae bacterium]|nr:MAG: ABC transporter permease [Desulfobacteraceae bacterium]